MRTYNHIPKAHPLGPGRPAVYGHLALEERALLCRQRRSLSPARLLELSVNLHPVILAGGYGTRLWPLSREDYPKQFLPLVGRRTMLQDTISRLDGMKGAAAPIIVCNEAHRFLVMDQVRELGASTSAVILEPASRNNAPALSLAALSLTGDGDSPDADPVMLVLPADHVIRDIPAFHAAVREGLALAEKGHLVTFGIAPTGPETGYGYIAKGRAYHAARDRVGAASGDDGRDAATISRQGTAFIVSRFVEKPDPDTARAYVESKEYLWNSGIFMMRASVWLAEIARYRPDIDRCSRAAFKRCSRDGDFIRPDSGLFVECPSDSIDYAVMEKAAGADPHDRQRGPGVESDFPASAPAGCVVVPLEAGWSDVGAWSAVWGEGDRDRQDNTIQGDVYTVDVRDSLLISNSRLLAAVGVDNLVVIETADAVLVARKDRAQDVKDIVERLKAKGRREQENHRKIHRPWGSFETIDEGPGFQVKRLTVRPGASLSLQRHHHRAENWVVVKGTARVTTDEDTFLLTVDQSVHIPVGGKHRLANPGSIPLEVIEVQVGDYLGEDDIVRFEDDYNRHNSG